MSVTPLSPEYCCCKARVNRVDFTSEISGMRPILRTEPALEKERIIDRDTFFCWSILFIILFILFILFVSFFIFHFAHLGVARVQRAHCRLAAMACPG